MTIYEALMKTAEHIERHPKLYDFATAEMGGQHACILGRLGSILGISAINADFIAPIAIKMDAQDFFRCLLALMPDRNLSNLNRPALVVPALRLFAQRYKNQMIPQAIREIFNPTPKEQSYAVV